MGQVDKKHFAVLNGDIDKLQDEFKRFGLYYQFVYGDEHCSLDNGFIVWNTEYTFEQFQKVMLGLCELYKLQSIYIIQKIDGLHEVTFWETDSLENIEYKSIKQFSKLKFKDTLKYFKIIKLGQMQEKACLASTACLMGAYKRHFLMKDLLNRVKQMRRGMQFEEFLEKVVNVTESPMDLEFKPAMLWLHLDRLPVGVVSLGSNSSVIRLPNRVIACEGNVVPVIALAYGLFTNRTDITDIILPNKLERISKDAFSGCSNLKRITIPRTVRLINERAFNNCENLEDVYFDGTEEEWKKIRVIHEGYREREPKKLGLYGDIETYIIPGNEALFKSKIHFNCVMPDDEEPHKLKRTRVNPIVYVYVENNSGDNGDVENRR